MTNEEFLEIPGMGQVRIVDTPNSLRVIEPRLGETSTLDRPQFGVVGEMMALARAVPKLTTQKAIDLVMDWRDRTPNIPARGTDAASVWQRDQVTLAASDGNEKVYRFPSQDIRMMTERAELLPAHLSTTQSQQSKGILMVEGIFQTVTPVYNHSFIVVERGIDNARMESLTKFVNSRNVVVTAQELTRAADLQRTATLRTIAPDLPVFRIDLRSGRRRIGKEFPSRAHLHR